MTDVSLIVLFSNEGLRAHQVLTSIERMCRFSTLGEISHEVLIVLDNASVETKGAVRHHMLSRGNAVILEYDYGDFSKSINNAILVSKGKYISILSGHLYLTENWLERSFRFIDRWGKQSILHNEYVVTFGQKRKAWRQVDLADGKDKISGLFTNDYWGLPTFAGREVYEKHPFGESPTHQDEIKSAEIWQWNCQTVSNAYVHRLVPETASFCVYSNDKMIVAPSEPANSMRPSDLFKEEIAKRLFVEAKPRQFSPLVEKLFGFYDRNLKSTIEGLRNRQLRSKIGLFYRMMKRAVRDDYPLWIEQEIKALALLVDPFLGSKKPWWRLDLLTEVSVCFEPGQVYARLLSALDPETTHCFVLPKILNDGSENDILRHIQILCDDTNNRVALFISGHQKNIPWVTLPKNTQWIMLGKFCEALSMGETALVLARLFQQLNPAVIHFMPTTLTSRVLEYCTKDATLSSQLYYSLRCSKEVLNAECLSRAHEILYPYHTSLSKVLTNNELMAKKLTDVYGYPASLLDIVHMHSISLALESKVVPLQRTGT